MGQITPREFRRGSPVRSEQLASMQMNDIFLSYARADIERARSLAAVLSGCGWSVWWDREIPPGSSFDETIESALNVARCVIVLWSSASVNSRWVRTEAGEGLARGILVPVLIETVQVPLEFRRIEAADLSDWSTESGHPELEDLIDSVRRVLEMPARTAAPPAEGLPRRASPRRRRRLPAVLAAVFVGVVLLALVGTRSQWTRLVRNAGALVAQPRPEDRSSPEEPPSVSDGLSPGRMNLLDASNGGHVVEAPTREWLATIDGNLEGVAIGTGGDAIQIDAVYAFKDRQPARVDTFAIYVPQEAAENVKTFELLSSGELSPSTFRSVGRFHVRNAMVPDAPFQAFTFTPFTARFLKFRLLSSYHGGYTLLTEFQAFGTLATH